MRKRNVLNSPRLLELKKRRRRAVLNKILISLFGFTVIVAALAYLSRLNGINITEIQVSGNKVVDTDMLKTVIAGDITGKYLLLFPKTNILIYPQNTIKKDLGNKFKRLGDINLSIKDNKILLVFVTERMPTYTWCGIVPPTLASPLPDINPPLTNTNNQQCYFADESGYIFDEAPYFSGGVYFQFYGLGDMNIGNPIGSSISNQNFQQLISFKNTLVDFGLKPTALYLANDKNAEIFLAGGANPSNEPKIIFKTDSDMQTIAENLEAALTTEPLQSKFNKKYSLLEYIDLRFGNRVYDKFSDTSSALPASPAPSVPSQ